MRNNKKILPILLVVTVAIWAVIGYKIYGAFAPNEPVFLATQPVNKEVAAKSGVEEYALMLDYRDPFLDKQFSDRPKRTSNPPANPVVRRKQEPPKRPPTVRNTRPKKWPTVEYNAYIKRVNSNKACAGIKINNEPYTVYVGDSVAEVNILKIYKDSIRVRFDSKEQVFNIK